MFENWAAWWAWRGAAVAAAWNRNLKNSRHYFLSSFGDGGSSTLETNCNINSTTFEIFAFEKPSIILYLNKYYI